MNMNQEMEERLWNYIDGVTNEEEKSFIENLLKSDAAFRAKYQELLSLHQLLGKVDLEEPSMRFTRNVMEEVAKYGVAKATSKYINKRIIWAIAAFFFIVIGAVLVYGFSEINWKATPTTSTPLPFDIKKWEPSKIMTNTYVNIFMMINVVLGLYLLDRFLAKKRNERMIEHNI